MSLTHAVIWTDHHAARVLLFDSEHVQAQKIRESTHYTRQHHSGVRTEHEFFGEVCDAVKDVDEVLITGSHTAVARFPPLCEETSAAHGCTHRRLRSRRSSDGPGAHHARPPVLPQARSHEGSDEHVLSDFTKS